MYAGCLKVEHVYTRAGLVQAAYTSVTSQKENNSQAIKAGSTGMEDQNPYKLRLLLKLRKR
jgi:hypothetical protein